MGNLKKFIANGFILTITSIFLRWVGVFYNTYISNKLGTEGMGVYTLVQSVFGFAITFACSGINLGATRLISEALANNNYSELKKSLKNCICYSLLFSLTALFVVYSGAVFIGEKVLGDVRTIKAIRLLALALPFISLSSVFNGYFSAVRRVYKSASVMILEQFIQIGVTVNILSFYAIKSVEYACMAVAVGILIAEISSLLYNFILWYIDSRKYKTSDYSINKNLSKKLLSISLPLALSTYVRSGLITIEHLLIPYGLRKNGATYSQAMSTYGLIQGMVFPIIMFSSCIIYSFAGLLVPELAAYNEKKQYNLINKTVSKVICFSLIFSVGVAGVLMCYAYELSVVFYNSSEAYYYIRLFAPLVVIMYLDGAIDGVLKGLNEQLHSMKINIADAFMSVLLVYFLVPHLGVNGYIIAVFVCEIFNCGMSLTRLVNICQPEISIIKSMLIPIFYIIVSSICVTGVFHYMGITRLTSKSNLAIRVLFTVLLYTFLNFRKKKTRKKEYKTKTPSSI